MKVYAIVVAALAAVVAADYEKPEYKGECEPATYACSYETGKPGWKVCNTQKKWEFAGYCPPKTACKFNEENGSPYCLPVYWKKEE